MNSNNSYIRVAYWLVLCATLCSCRSQRITTPKEPMSPAEEITSQILNHPVLSEHFTGFILADPDKDGDIININGDYAFTPASNTKLFSYASARTVVGDSLPTIAYATYGDTLVIRGTGDPYHLGQYDRDTMICKFLDQYANDHSIYYRSDHFLDQVYGTGWAWDDYAYSYNKMINALPLYDNELQLSFENGKPRIRPDIATVDIDTSLPRLYQKQQGANHITVNPDHPRAQAADRTWSIPMHINDTITTRLLSEACGVSIDLWDHNIQHCDHPYTSVYRSDQDSIYRDLLRHSDNYIAEQMMRVVSYELYDTIHLSRTMDSMKVRLLGDDTAKTIRWVDGSGLSRYNLITPRALITLLRRLNQEMTAQERKKYLPYGDEGTISGELLHPIGDSTAVPYIYAKTGTLSNNHNLSGWITTRRGKTYLFSFMNNHYLRPKKEVVRAMSEVLSSIYWEL